MTTFLLYQSSWSALRGSWWGTSRPCFSPSVNPMQFSCCPNQSTDFATTVHLALTHLNNKGIDLSIQHNQSSAPDWKTEPAGSCISRCNWTSWLGDFSQSVSGAASPAPPHWVTAVQQSHRTTLKSQITSGLQMTWLWVSSARIMSQHTGRRCNS